MKKYFSYILSFMFLFGLSQAKAEEVSFSASVNKRVLSIQDTLVLSLKIVGAQKVGAPGLPPIEGLNLVYGPSVSSQTQIINGVVSTKRIFEYGFSPSKEGVVTIPSFVIEIAGDKYRSDAIEVEFKKGVVAPEAQDSLSTEGSTNLSERIFVELIADKTEVVVNEQIILSFRLYRNISADNLSYNPPVTKGFLEEPLGKQRTYRKVVNGVEYEVVEIRKALFPLKSGTLKIPSVSVQGTLLFQSKSQQRSKSRLNNFFLNDPFTDSFFGRRYIRRPIELKSDSISIKVNPLPKGKPANFSGAVGQFSLKVTTAPEEVAVGDPVTVTMTVLGRGNLQSIQSPVFKGELDKFKVYEPESKTNIISREEGLQGEKVFEVVLVPKEVVAETPAIEFSFFNPELQEYEIFKKGPFPLKVTPSTALLLPTRPVLSEKQSVELLTRDIFTIKTKLGELQPVGNLIYKQPILYSLLSFPLFIYFGLFLLHLKREKHRLNPKLARFSRAGRHARLYLKKAGSVSEAKEAFSLIEKAIIEFLAHKTNQPQGALNLNEIASFLGDHGFSPEQSSQIQEVLRACEMGRFAGTDKEEQKISALINQTKLWLVQAEKVLR